MQDWDRLVMVLIGAAVGAYTGYDGWRLWQRQQRRAALGALLLVAASVAIPMVLALFGG